jgi:hypothetical protein
MQDRQRAQVFLAEAFRRAEASQESRMNAELLILQAELEHDDRAAQGTLVRALQIADEQSAIATALRAVAMGILRSGGAADVATATETLDILDGRLSYPIEHNWMGNRLAKLRRELH